MWPNGLICLATFIVLCPMAFYNLGSKDSLSQKFKEMNMLRPVVVVGSIPTRGNVNVNFHFLRYGVGSKRSVEFCDEQISKKNWLG